MGDGATPGEKRFGLAGHVGDARMRWLFSRGGGLTSLRSIKNRAPITGRPLRLALPAAISAKPSISRAAATSRKRAEQDAWNRAVKRRGGVFSIDSTSARTSREQFTRYANYWHPRCHAAVF